ncbi:MAG: LLM class flavin-dependent oxidoreductase [Deltaproteobacteria bacterium]|nr:LLM class flavin-dependent oxidoreductase [Deltaproteobacteria bacterium]
MGLNQRIGIDFKDDGLDCALSAQDVLDLARQAEAAGFESVWLNEDIGRDSMAMLAAMATTTKRIGIGTAIVNVYTRSAFQIAMGAATLDELSGGRARLGLSVGHHPWNDLAHGIPLRAPLARCREYVQFVRKALTGEKFTHDGPVFSGVNSRLGVHKAPKHLPIYVGATRPRMVALAGEVADGLLTNVVSPYYVANFSTHQFRDAARKAGRNPDALELTAITTCCANDNRAEALSHARATFMQRFRSNPDRMIGTQSPKFHDELRELKDLVERGETKRAQEQISEGLATTFVAAGSGADIRKTIDEYFSAGCTRVIVAPFPRGRDSAERLIRALSD